MNINLLKQSAFLLLLLLPAWQWAQTVDLTTFQNNELAYQFQSAPNDPSVVLSPSNGEIDLVESPNFNFTVTYTPNANFIGVDQYRIIRWESFPAPHFEILQVNIVVEPALIQANHDFVSAYAGQPVMIEVLTNDLSSNGVKSIQAVPAANNGGAVFTPGGQTISFTSDPDYRGLAHFNYVICNGMGDCDEGTVSVSVMGMDPINTDETIRVFTKKNESQYILVAPDYVLVDHPTNGVFDAGADVPEYIPSADYVGMDEIRFTDGDHDIIYEIEVLDLVRNTFAVDDRVFITTNSQEVEIYVLENDLGVGSNVELGLDAENGTVGGFNGSFFTYTPDFGFVGVDQFTYTSSLAANGGEVETATVDIFVSNFEPDRTTFYMATPKETPIIIGYNVPVSTFSFDVSAQGSLGQAYFLDGAVDTTIAGLNITGDNMLIYTPNAGVTAGTDEFEITYCLDDPSSNNCVVSKTVKIYMDILDVGAGDGPVCVGNCVWPGDTNFDGVVNMTDLLPIGLNMGEIGTGRAHGITSFWYGQYADDWGNLFASGGATSFDIKHIDADGNSIVTATDTMAIRQFYGKTHSMVPVVAPYVPYDFILKGPLFVEPGDLVSLEIHVGTSQNPAEDVYGFVFPFSYNSDYIDETSLNVRWANDNWLSYNSPVLHMQHNDEEGLLEAGYTRTSGLSASGHGELGIMNAIIVEDFIGFRPDQKEIHTTIGGLAGTSMNGDGLMSQANVQPYNMRIVLKEEQDALQDDDLKAWPNPTGSYLTVHLNGQREFEEVRIFTLTGRPVKTVTGILTNHIDMNLSSLISGIYVLQVVTADGLINRKIEILR